jgi:hypothetical protein
VAGREESILSNVFARADYDPLSDLFLFTFISMYQSGQALARDKILLVM